MVRIGTVGRVGAARVVPARDAATRPDAVERTAVEPDPVERSAAETAGRSLAVIDGGRRDEPRGPARNGVARPGAGFVAQLLVAADPGLQPSRLERTRVAAARYAETARRLA